MDFTWSKDQQALREAVVELARAELNEGLHERDEREEFNRAGWDKLAAFGIHGAQAVRGDADPAVGTQPRHMGARAFDKATGQCLEQRRIARLARRDFGQ